MLFLGGELAVRSVGMTSHEHVVCFAYSVGPVEMNQDRRCFGNSVRHCDGYELGVALLWLRSRTLLLAPVAPDQRLPVVSCDRKHLWLDVRVPCRNVNRVPLALLPSRPLMWPGGLLSTSTCRLEVSFEVALVGAFVGGVQEMEKKLLPAVPSLWRSWAQAALDGAR